MHPIRRPEYTASIGHLFGLQMDQLELFELPNPCIGVCESDNRGYCKGCLRSRDERFNWPQKPVAEKARILKLLAQRRKRREQKSGSSEAGYGPSTELDLFD